MVDLTSFNSANQSTKVTDVLINTALKLFSENNFRSSFDIFQKILKIDPKNCTALYYSASIAINVRNHKLAIEFLVDFVEIETASSDAYFLLGVAYRETNQIIRALNCFDTAILIDPKFANAFSNRGVVQRELGAHEAAIDSYSKAIAFNPDYGNYYSRGISYLDLGNIDLALSDFEKSINLNANFPQAYLNHGLALFQKNDFHKSLISFNKAITLNPHYAEAFNNRSNIFFQMKNIDLAFKDCNFAITLNPNFSPAYLNRGIFFSFLGNFDAAIFDFEKAIQISFDYPDAHFNYGLLLNVIGNHSAALHHFNKAIFFKEHYPEAYWNKALIELLLGDFQNGFSNYEWRWHVKSLTIFNLKREFSKPLWTVDTDSVGKCVFLHAEQGLGDSIQFCRYAELVANTGANVVLEVQQPLFSFLSQLNSIVTVIAQGDPIPPFDYHCPLISLPLAFKTDLASIPTKSQYLTSEPTKVLEWQLRIGPKEKPRIGIAWSGSPSHKNNRNRSIALKQFLELLSPAFQFICLQKEIHTDDKLLLSEQSEVLCVNQYLTDFSETAALCETLDLIICVDTSIAHLASALGKRTWVLLPANPDWRWLLDREDSPWYQSIRLFRQSVIGEWSSVIRAVKNELRQSFGS